MLETAQSYIYGLFDPDDQAIRYVGQTTRPNARLCMHASARPNPNNGSVAKDWIAGMLREDRYPCMIILEICDFSVAHQRESDWYKRLCEAGYPIINNTSKFNRPRTSREAKPYKHPLTHGVFSIIEVDFLYISHDPSAPESQAKFGTILEAMEKLGNGNLSAGIRKAIDTMTSTLTTAQAIYREVYGDIDNKFFKQHKVAEIQEWIDEGDTGDSDNLDALVAEWRIYDAHEIAERNV